MSSVTYGVLSVAPGKARGHPRHTRCCRTAPAKNCFSYAMELQQVRDQVSWCSFVIVAGSVISIAKVASLLAATAGQQIAEATLRSAFEGQGVTSGDAIMLQAVSTARDTQRQLAALRVQVVELTQQAQQLKLQEEVVVTRVRGEAALATKIMEEEAQV